jgi:flagellar biosynthesis chaperone FliJ
MGFLAHEVQEIFPFLVNGEKDGLSYQSVNYNGFIALLVKEIQDLKKRLKKTEDQLQSVLYKLEI